MIFLVENTHAHFHNEGVVVLDLIMEKGLIVHSTECLAQYITE